MALRQTNVHNCLLEVRSAGGAEFQPVVINVTVMLTILMGPNIMWWPAVTYVVHKLLQWMFNKDPYMSRIFVRYMREGDFFDPWPKANQFINKRPSGAGRDLLC